MFTYGILNVERVDYMLNANKLKIILAFISLLMCIMTVQQTYAKYVTSTNAAANMTVARWKILVNDEDIHTGQNLNNVIAPTFAQTDYIAEGVVAPTSTGYFDIVIDSSNTDLSFSYTIATTVANDSSVSDLKPTGYSVNNGTVTNFTDTNYTLTNQVLYSTHVTTNTVRIYFTWNDGDGQNMDNATDTNASYNTEQTPKLNISLSFIQLAS
jgi:hypothetical protein